MLCTNASAITYPDAIETAKEMVTRLRETENAAGTFTDGEDVRLAKAVPGDQGMADEIEALKKTVTTIAFASRGYSIDQPLAVAPRDIPNTFSDIPASTILANLCTDAFRKATKADIGLTVNGMMRAGFIRGKSGVQTVYDVFAIAPLGAGVLDTTAGSTLVTGYFTGQELKHILEFFLVDNAAHPGEPFPRASGLKIRYDMSRPKFDVVTALELSDPAAVTRRSTSPGRTRGCTASRPRWNWR